MPDSGAAVGTLLLSNATADPISIWLEPWADECTLAPRSELSLEVTTPDGGAVARPEIESSEGLITIWGSGGSLIRVTIDGIEQKTGSAIIPSPDTGALSPRAFIEMGFGNFPEARPGGQPLPTVASTPRISWRDRLLRWFGRR
jgi:hypothetical protein